MFLLADSFIPYVIKDMDKVASSGYVNLFVCFGVFSIDVQRASGDEKINNLRWEWTGGGYSYGEREVRCGGL